VPEARVRQYQVCCCLVANTVALASLRQWSYAQRMRLRADARRANTATERRGGPSLALGNHPPPSHVTDVDITLAIIHTAYFQHDIHARHAIPNTSRGPASRNCAAKDIPGPPTYSSSQTSHDGLFSRPRPGDCPTCRLGHCDPARPYNDSAIGVPGGWFWEGSASV
jgi:hypothetical protein